MDNDVHMYSRKKRMPIKIVIVLIISSFQKNSATLEKLLVDSSLGDISQTLRIICVGDLARCSSNTNSSPRPPNPTTLSIFLHHSSRARARTHRRSRGVRSSRRSSSRSRSRHHRWSSRCIVRPYTARLGSQCRWTANLLEANGRVVGAFEPVEAPITSCFQRSGEGVAH